MPDCYDDAEAQRGWETPIPRGCDGTGHVLSPQLLPNRLSHTGGAAALLGLIALIGAAANAQAPTVSYAPEAGARQLLFCNNPEQVYLSYTDTVTGSATNGITYYDLADATQGAHSLLQVTVDPGSYRDLFEHVNKTGSTVNYGVQVYNPNSTTPVFVTFYGKGYYGNVTAPGYSTGGQAIAEMLNNEAQSSPATYKVYPGRTLWLLRSDVDYSGTRPNSNGTYASGVVDFDLSGGQAIVSNVAYQNLRSLSSWSYMGYVPRAYSASTPESRVYKGLLQYPAQISATGAGVVASLSFVVDDSTPAGELSVQYPRYTNNGSGTWAPSAATVGGTDWWTNDTPLRDKLNDSAHPTSTNTNVFVTGNDMFDINMPGWSPVVYALQPGSWPNTTATQPNFGNYGVTYHEAITLTNNSQTGKTRTVSVTMYNYGGSSSSVAYRNVTSGSWTYDYCRNLANGKGVTYGSFSVPPDGLPHTYDLYYILGAPAAGTLRHAVQLTN